LVQDTLRRWLYHPDKMPDDLLSATGMFADGIPQVEDAMVASRMQANIKSSAFSVGPMAKDYEASIAAFHDNYLEILSK